jgi:hypothetical protein
LREAYKKTALASKLSFLLPHSPALKLRRAQPFFPSFTSSQPPPGLLSSLPPISPNIYPIAPFISTIIAIPINSIPVVALGDTACQASLVLDRLSDY